MLEPSSHHHMTSPPMRTSDHHGIHDQQQQHQQRDPLIVRMHARSDRAAAFPDGIADIGRTPMKQRRVGLVVLFGLILVLSSFSIFVSVKLAITDHAHQDGWLNEMILDQSMDGSTEHPSNPILGQPPPIRVQVQTQAPSQSLPQPQPQIMNLSQDFTFFPHFMTQQQQHPSFADPKHSNCTSTSPDLPGIHAPQEFPTSYAPQSFLRQVHGDFEAAWNASGQYAHATIATAACYITNPCPLNHFPHFLQHIVQCWSLWETFPDSEHALILDPGRLAGVLKASSFGRGIVKMLESEHIVINETTTDGYEQNYSSSLDQLLIVMTKQTRWFEMEKSEHLQSFRQKMMESIPIQKNATVHCSAAMHVNDPAQQMQLQHLNRTREPLPRIAILNRKGHRRLLDSNTISNILMDRLALTYRPPVLYFEAFSFEQQAEAFTNVDIIISPHGAQSTGIFFMPRCGSLIEIFPPGLDSRPWFGTMAALSGLNYSYVYVGKRMKKETEKIMLKPELRSKARKQLVCAPVETIVATVMEQIDHWRRCCGLS